MALGYTHQHIIVLVGSRTGTTRTSIDLLSSYDATTTKAFTIGGMVKVEFFILYTMGSGETSNTIEIKLEISPDGTNWYQLVNDTTSGGTSTLDEREFSFQGVDATVASIALPVDIQGKHMRISVKESGVVTNAGTIYVEATLSGEK